MASEEERRQIRERQGDRCFHCLVGIETGLISEETNKTIKGVDEGFPDWQKPTKADLRQQDYLL